jgi:hypothetical protein
VHSKNDHPVFKALGSYSLRTTISPLNRIISLVYSTVLIAIAASAIEAEATYAFLVPVWGDPKLGADIPVVSNILGDLQPLLDAAGELRSQLHA